MKMKIAILGSTGSIGKSTLDVIRKDKNFFEVVFLSANNNYKKLIQQAKEFNVKNILIKNQIFHERTERSLKNSKTKVYSGDISLTNIISKKLDYTMAAIVGVAGLQPTIDAIKISKTVALANKESIICGWEILSKLIKKYKTKILPVDSEHFSIMELTKDISDEEVEEIIITASGGPFLNLPQNKLNYVKPTQAINHPNWKMGKKISIDSANLMNKVFEVIEACRIFKFNKKKYRIMIHPQSYVHSIIRFKNGLIKMILYNTDMKIPISNTLYGRKNHVLNVKKIDARILSKLSFQNVNTKRFPSIKLINKCLNLGFLAPTIVNASNEVLVSLFLTKKIGFLKIVKTINKIFRDKDFKKHAKRKPESIKDIQITDNWARLKTLAMCVR
ncbi:MAG: 1-deoxy-D-xylulose-5-phosphate reductoisomerase [Alphaproteobacteria bacterium]|nr:MAG: 1-deoxy-D-xylulose-5-phosphate reductoisomerase [Alphaproteobacteria bacterium]